MENYSIVLLIMGLMIGLSAVANRIKIPYPILLVSAGIAIGFIPGMPEIAINPEVVFLLFLPPLLYDAAFNISIKQLRSNLATVATLAIPLVFLTTSAVAVVIHFLIPEMTWPLSFVLGAILSPPDAVAATGVTKGLGLSHRTLTILEGESLVNDASGLIAYRFAVAAIAGVGVGIWNMYLQFILVVAGGVFVGIVVGVILATFLRQIYGNSLIAISAMALAPFISYLLAEEFHVSGVLAVVVLGITLARYTNKLFPSQTKIQNKSFWDVIIFLLNGLVFILIGLEFPQVVNSISHQEILPLIGYSFLISFIMLVIRMVWMFGHSNNLRKATIQKKENPGKFRFSFYADENIDWKNSLIIGWSGMRGIVSLASALALPLTLSSGEAFPQRDVLIFMSVIVVLITLLVQGLSLPLLVRVLKVDEMKTAK
ncbi:Na+/H+ antiporter [Dyadobacter psychrotolerans]|uniref:Na+/H+ antiporter n=1 Tax=Dyadobacter psychrotolerans TaxID=2541721 RepID=A0A4V2Z524_9BACT|nr:Na+/H+ antiporter [Dyadobacter psychrotolerans]TDE17628.1 Na+/H+ antiporter [Dyadobacter psychrotolerans]